MRKYATMMELYPIAMFMMFLFFIAGFMVYHYTGINWLSGVMFGCSAWCFMCGNCIMAYNFIVERLDNDIS